MDQLRIGHQLYQEQGKEPKEIVVIKKTSEEHEHVIPEDKLENIEEYKDSTEWDHRVSFNDLMQYGDINHKKTDSIVEVGMEMLAELERAGMIVLSREIQQIHQNFRLTETEYAKFMSDLKIETNGYRALWQQFSNELGGLKRG